MKKAVVYLDDEQYEIIRKLAFDQRVSISELVRQAIDAWLKAQN
jgi:Arc/MetJ-type ribon-helix-helix transcriptional regulator